MTKFFGDLFKGPGNNNWELARFLAAWAVASFSFAFLWQLLKLAQALDFASVGTGFGIVLAGAGALIWAKDTARTAAISQVKQDATAAAAPAIQPVEVVNTPANPVPVEEGR